MALANSPEIVGRFHTVRFYMADLTVYLLKLSNSRIDNHHLTPPKESAKVFGSMFFSWIERPPRCEPSSVQLRGTL